MFRSFSTFARAARTARGYATAAGEDFQAHRAHVKEHAAGAAETWRKVTLYVATPAIIVGAINTKGMMDEHHAHVEHIKEENGGELPERVVYPYFNKRDKDFPWGPQSFFYTEGVNIAAPEE